MSPQNRSKTRLLTGLLVLPLLLSACGGDNGNEGEETSSGAGDTIVLAAQGEVPPIDPHRLTGTLGLRISDAIYDTLLRENVTEPSDGLAELQPALAEDWTVSDDGTVFEFWIRDGVTFHDDTPLDAEAVKLNFDRLMDEGSSVYSEEAAANMGFVTQWVDSTEVTSNGTFMVTLTEPFPEFANLLADRRAGIVSPALLESADDDQIAATPVGTGPYISDGISAGEDITLDRNSEYWRGEPLTPQLLFTSMADSNTMVSAMETDQIDIIMNAGATQVSRLGENDAFTVQYPDPANSYFLRLNTQADNATNDVDFRQALNYAVDREAIAEVMGGQSRPVYGAIPAGNSAWSEDMETLYTYDPDQARELIEESDLSTPVNISLLAPSGGPGFSQSNEVMSLIQQNFADVGVELDIEFMEFTSLVALEGPGYESDVNGSYNGWSTSVNLAYWLETMFSPERQPPEGFNRGWYDNPELGEKFDEARSETDDEERAALYREAASIINEDAPWVFLYQDRLPRILTSDISGPVEAPSLYFDYATLDKE